ncbi:MAG: hypothetical protein AAGA65_30220 [Actinomycetota bacterium]
MVSKGRGKMMSDADSTEVWARGVAVGLALWLLLQLIIPVALAFGVGDGGDVLSGSPVLALAIGGLPVAVLTLTTRLPAALAVTIAGATELALVFQVDHGSAGRGPVLSSVLFLLTTSGVAWWLALRTSGRRALSPPAALATLLALATPAVVIGPSATIVGPLLALFGMLIAGLALVRTDPRPIITAATLWALLALNGVAFGVLNDSALTVIESIVVVGVPLLVSGIAARLGYVGTQRLIGSGGL